MAKDKGQLRDFEAAFAAPDAETPADAAAPTEEAPEDQGDMKCPCCGASAMNIVKAAQAGGGGMGMGGGGMKMGGM